MVKVRKMDDPAGKKKRSRKICGPLCREKKKQQTEIARTGEEKKKYRRRRK